METERKRKENLCTLRITGNLLQMLQLQKREDELQRQQKETLSLRQKKDDLLIEVPHYMLSSLKKLDLAAPD